MAESFPVSLTWLQATRRRIYQESLITPSKFFNLFLGYLVRSEKHIFDILMYIFDGVFVARHSPRFPSSLLS